MDKKTSKKEHHRSGNKYSGNIALSWSYKFAGASIIGITFSGIAGCAVIPATTTTTSSVANVQPGIQSPEVMMQRSNLINKPNEVVVRIVVDENMK
jgi:hypothetical protein